ncbi:hypothetical protein AX15_000709 [Amanita polypyramis BW_CC]|nr:hypothetical protein AX15_000709 [Amanita polypyramis BW_CC]
MSSGPPNNFPTVISPDDYQANMARIEQARRMLDTYTTMNEEAKKKFEEYEQDLARRIAEGDKARQELERLRGRNAPLAITAPPVANSPQITHTAPNPVYLQTTGRVEEVPSYSRRSDQKSLLQNTYSLASQAQTGQWAAQPQTSHTSYNSARTTQKQPIQVGGPIYPYHESFPSQIRSQTRHVPTNQPPVHNQALQSVWPQQASSQAIQAHTPQIVRQEQHKRVPPDVRQSTTTVQQRQVPQSATTITQQQQVQQVPQNPHPRSTALQQQALQHVHQQATATQQWNAKSVSTSDPQAFASVAQNSQFIEYLRAAFARMKSSIPINSYVPVPNTSYYIVKHFDHSMSLLIPNAQGNYTSLDLPTLLSCTTNMTPNMPVQQPVAQASAPVSRPTTSRENATQIPIQASSTKPQEMHPPPQSTASLQLQSPQARTQAQLQPPRTQLQSQLQSPQNQIQLQPQPSQVQTQSRSQPASTQGWAATVVTGKPLQRTPADVDKSHLARYVLRALGVKRPRPSGSSGLQFLEPAAKRHESRSTEIIAITGGQGTQSVIGVTAAVNGVQRSQPGRPAAGMTAAINGGQATQPQTTQPKQPIIDTAPAVSEARDTRESAAPEAQGTQQTQLIPTITPAVKIIETIQPTSAPPISEPQVTQTSSTEPEPVLTLVSPLVSMPAASALGVEVVEMPSPSDEVELVSATIVELSPEPEPIIETVKELPKGPSASAAPIPRDTDQPVSVTVPYAVQSAPAATVQSFDLQRHSDDAVNELNRLNIQEQAIIPADKEVLARTEGFEEGEIDVQMQEDEKESPEEGELQVVLGSTGETQDDLGPLSTEQFTPKQPMGEEGNKKPSKMPLFLPSPSSSLKRSTSPNEDVSMEDSTQAVTTKRGRLRKSVHRRTITRRQRFYILIPPPPPYVTKYKEQEAKRRRKRQNVSALQSNDYSRRIQYNRSASQEDTVDPVTALALRDSTTRLAERRCKWSSCDVVMNSSRNLFEHLRRQHCSPDFTKRYILCYWTGCGDHVPNSQIDEHFGSHAFFPLSCPHRDCEESFRVVQSLMKHNDSNHRDTPLKKTAEPFTPTIKEPPNIPSKHPAYMINSGLVRQESIPQYRHNLLGPWVYNNIAGPSLVTKRYNAAKGKPLECEVLQTPSQQFSTNPSRPAKVRDMRDLASVEVSGMASGGLVIWPPRKKKIVAGSSSEDELKPKMPKVDVIDGSEEDGLREEDLFGDDVVMGQGEIRLGDETLGKISASSSNTIYQASEEEAVETMLTEQ